MLKIVSIFMSLVCLSSYCAAQVNVEVGNGKILEQSVFPLPSYDQIPVQFQTAYGREAVDRIKNSTDLELSKIKYLSDGLKIVGFIYKPKDTTNKKLPAIIWNRGGVGEETKISVENFQDIYEMYKYAAAGFVVLASQYRGTDGGEGRDEVGGGDTDDVLNLLPLARSLGYIDMDRIFMWGFSRGAMMTLQALQRGAPIKAAVVVGAPTDWALSLQENPRLLSLVKNDWPDFETRREEHIFSRSAVRWADKLNVPLLIFQGGSDPAVSPRQALELAQKMDEAGNLYELIVYAKDDHFVTLNSEERLQKTIDWFKNVRTIPISQSFRTTAVEKGIAAAIEQYNNLKKTQPGRYDFSESQLNALGYEFLFEGRPKDAIEIFKVNVNAYPQSFNVYDSLGEAYLAIGNREEAIKNYKRSVELNPQNANGIQALKKLGQP